MRANIKTLRGRLNKGVLVCAVVKANAYSFGDTLIAKAIEREVDWFAVATLAEARRVRAVTAKPILLFATCEDFKEAKELDLVVSINSVDEMKRLSRVGGTCHIKVNTGMNRHGVQTLWQLRRVIEVARDNPNIKVDGLYTHMAFEENHIDEVDKQLKRFQPYIQLFKRSFRGKGLIHAACSGAMHYSPAQFDMVRVGKAIYGGYAGYKTAMTLTSKVVGVQNIRRGEYVGYAGTFVASQPMKVGIVPCGYADFVHFNFSNRTCVEVDGVRCKILGRVCMDSFMVDVTAVPRALGKPVTITAPKKGLGIMDHVMAARMVTCEYLCTLDFSRARVTYE